MSDKMNLKQGDIIIIGAGLTGLTLGYFLKESGKKVVIVEKEEKPGGVINTGSENGFIYETGPNTGVLSTPEIAQLFDGLNGRCTLEKAGSGSGKRYILKDGTWCALPSGPASAIATPLFTLKDKFRILGEPFRKQGTNPDETIAELVIRRLGKSYLDYAVDPFISGIYAGDPYRLVTRFALPKLYALEQKYGSFIRGAVAKGTEHKDPRLKKATREVFSVRGGLSNLISALADVIGKDNILTSCNGSVTRQNHPGYEVTFTDSSGITNCVSAPMVISTVGAFALAPLFPFIPDNYLDKINSLNYAGIVQVSAGFKNWRGKKLDAFGGLVPAKEQRSILGILFPSAIFEGRAPEGGALLSVFMGGVKNSQMILKTDKEITDIALGEIAGTLWHKGEPDLLKISRYRHAIPQYEASSQERLESISIIQREYPGLILAGNIRDGIGMADRVRQAKSISDMLSN